MESLNNFFLSPTVSAIVALATLLALLLAVYESMRSKRQSTQLQSVSEEFLKNQRELEKISQSLSTKVIGIFPNYLDRLAELISSAENSVRIMCAYPQHGAFSCPDGWSKLEGAIREVIRNDEIGVELVFSSSRVRLENDREQFHEALSDWDSWKNRNSRQLSVYFQKNSGGVNTSDYHSPQDLKTCEDWFQLQELCEQNALAVWRGWDGLLDITEVDELMPVFVWIRDDNEAIFVLMSYEQSAVSYAFYTCDAGLVGALASLVHRYKERLAKKEGQAVL
jgi:hypothetical protein